jgi:hypothetical protein
VYLAGDLDCAPETENAVEIRSGGTLDMRGFRIHGAAFGVLCSDEGQMIGDLEVYTYRPCRVFGGGTIDGQKWGGIVASRLDLRDVTLVEEQSAIALIIHRHLTFANVTLQLDSMGEGIIAGPKVNVQGTGLTVTGGHIGIGYANVVKIDGVTASGYSDFLRGVRTVKLKHASLVGGGSGIDATNVALTDSSVTGHSGTAVHAERIKLVGSTVTGNGLDLDAEQRPKLKDSTCETSNGWGVCTND